MRRIYLIAGGVVVGLVGAMAFGQIARSDLDVDSIPNCAYQFAISASLDRPSYDTPEAAAGEVVEAIEKGGGRPDGTDVGELLELEGGLTFYLPELATDDDADGYGLIVVAEMEDGTFLAEQARFCEGSVPDPFPWGLEDEA